MKILIVASEAVPFAKTGGLADVIGSLPQALSRQGVEVRVVIPAYGAIDPLRFTLKPMIKDLPVPEGQGGMKRATVLTFQWRGVDFFFIGNDNYFSRPGLYQDEKGDYADNLERFAFFSRATLEMLRYLKFQPEIIHAHDWQTALLSTYLKSLYRDDPFFAKVRTVFTIHNLGYQGLFPKEKFPLTGLSWDLFTPQGLEFYGQVNILKAGLISSDLLTTVSPTYAREIQEGEAGFGLDGVLRERRDRLYGILNGLDYEEWDPSRDKDVKQKFGLRTIEKRRENRKDLQRICGLPESEDFPILGMVTRLADQKGLDILAEAIPQMMRMNLQIVILGTGERKYHALLSKIARKYPRKIAVNLRYDPLFAKKIYAGCDIFLMPSRYEPCGLGQLIALRYGAIPLVHSTGGLSDTIRDFEAGTGEGNGFSFQNYSSEGLLSAFKKALSIYHQKETWGKLIANALNCDFSWEASAREYTHLYNMLLGKQL